MKSLDGTTQDEEIMKIPLKVKENVNVTTAKIKMAGLDVAGEGIGRRVNAETELIIGEDIEEKLYLSSDVYKIGDHDIDNYEDGDIYLEKITPETTVKEFISNCETNGTIKVLDAGGKELKETDLVGTNMTIKVTGHGEEFILTAVVMGDLDGNGLVTVTDLSGINQTVLKTIKLTYSKGNKN